MKCCIESAISCGFTVSQTHFQPPHPPSSLIGDLVPRAAPVSHYSHWWFSNRLLSSLAIVLSLPYCLQLVPTYIYLQPHGLNSAPLLAHPTAPTRLMSAAPFLLSLLPLQTQHKPSLSTVRCSNDFVLSWLIRSICQGVLQALSYFQGAFIVFKSTCKCRYCSDQPSFKTFPVNNIKGFISLCVFIFTSEEKSAKKVQNLSVSHNPGQNLT